VLAVSELTRSRFKNYEDAYERGLAAEDKDYASNPSAAQSTSSVARIKVGDGLATPEKEDPESDDDDDNEAGMSPAPFLDPFLPQPRY
jgi:hypothetical protein